MDLPIEQRSYPCQDPYVSVTVDANKEKLATYIVAQQLLGRTAKTLSSVDIPVMPLKGVLLQATTYERPWDRDITDIDLLVPEECFKSALDCLVGAGCTFEYDPTGAANVRWPDIPISIDLHSRLFPQALFRLPTAEVFARARPNSDICGHRIWIADPLDTYAHLVGHFVKSRLDNRDTKYFRDLNKLAEREALDPYFCARHLQRCGLARAARYVLPLVVSAEADAFSALVLQALERDRVGDAVVKVAELAIPRIPKSWIVGAIPVHLLNVSFAAGLRSLSYRFLYVSRYKRREKRRLFSEQS